MPAQSFEVLNLCIRKFPQEDDQVIRTWRKQRYLNLSLRREKPSINSLKSSIPLRLSLVYEPNLQKLNLSTILIIPRDIGL